MRILHISDTHSKHRELPPLPNADIIIHSGDFTFAGSENEAYDFGFVIYLSNIRYLLLAIMICVCMVQILLMVCQIMYITYVTTVLKLVMSHSSEFPCSWRISWMVHLTES